MLYFTFEVDGPVDPSQFDRDWELQRELNGWPPVMFAWDAMIIRASTESDYVTDEELRKMLNFALGHQHRRLLE
jgi:hypothetical protein